jgi:hypothetical protein
MPKFVHIRNRDRAGKILPHGGFTVAYERVATDDGDFVRYAVAKCAKRDHYNRKRGATISSGRLSTGRHPFMLPIDKGDRPLDVVVNAVYAQSGGFRLLPR